MKEEALKLLDKWDSIGSSRDTLLWAADAYAMIRRLVEELNKKPLSDEEIMKEWDKAHRIGATKKRHGIK